MLDLSMDIFACILWSHCGTMLRFCDDRPPSYLWTRPFYSALFLILFVTFVAHSAVTDVPLPPHSLTVMEVTAKTVRLSWDSDNDRVRNLLYVVQYKQIKKGNADYKEVAGISTKLRTVDRLKPFTEYEFRVAAMNAVGRSWFSPTVSVITGEIGWYFLLSLSVRITHICNFCMLRLPAIL